jgi:hypothetical protein
MRITRIYTGEDGESHLEEVELPIETAGERAATVLIPAARTGFGFLSVTEALGWHPAPRRQIVTILAGEMEIECAEGSKARFVPGDAFIADDLTGHGHLTRYPVSPLRIQYVLLPDDLDLASFR